MTSTCRRNEDQKIIHLPTAKTRSLAKDLRPPLVGVRSFPLVACGDLRGLYLDTSHAAGQELAAAGREVCKWGLGYALDPRRPTGAAHRTKVCTKPGTLQKTVVVL